MKLIAISLFITTLIFTSCNKSDDNPTTPTPSPEKKFMTMYPYQFIIDSSYYKVWSDSSWEKFNRITNINGRIYVSIINSSGNEYFYDAIGYAGFKPVGESIIIFDKSLAVLPDTVFFNQTYTGKSSFFYKGYNYSIQMDYTLLDTVSISVPIGVFSPCLWFKSTVTVSASGQSQSNNSQFWLAKGPSSIKETSLNTGTTIVMVRGVVNGKGWGMSYPKISNSKENFLLTQKVNVNFQNLLRKVNTLLLITKE